VKAAGLKVGIVVTGPIEEVVTEEPLVIIGALGEVNVPDINEEDWTVAVPFTCTRAFPPLYSMDEELFSSKLPPDRRA
jgi:hypothetical protein